MRARLHLMACCLLGLGLPWQPAVAFVARGLHAIKMRSLLLGAETTVREELMTACDIYPPSADSVAMVGLIVPRLVPTTSPLTSWGAGMVAETECPLHGLWQLRYTTDKHDSFSSTGRRGRATCMQYINATSGTLTNIVDFNQWQGKVKGFSVILDGAVEPGVGGTPSLQLTRRRVEVERRSRVGLSKISLHAGPLALVSALLQPLSPVLPGLARSLQPPGTMTVLYVDDEVQVHSSRGHTYVLSRLYDVWDPAVGWRLISMV